LNQKQGIYFLLFFQTQINLYPPHRLFLYSVRNKGVIKQVSRGVYRLIELPPILEFPSPLLLCRSRESSIAEKFEAKLKLQSARCALAPLCCMQ